MAKRIIVGSVYFFSRFSDFKSKDIDYVVIDDEPIGYRNFMQITMIGDYCEFHWRRMGKEELINFTLGMSLGMNLGKFLVGEFDEEFGISVDDLKKLEPMLAKLDERHMYEKMIYEYYIQNGKMELTDKQLETVYEEYKKEREK